MTDTHNDRQAVTAEASGSTEHEGQSRFVDERRGACIHRGTQIHGSHLVCDKYAIVQLDEKHLDLLRGWKYHQYQIATSSAGVCR